MPVNDVPIYRDGPVAVPLNYTLPATQEIQVRSVEALFNGASAAGPFIPAFVIVDQTGHVIARGADPSNVVAAGASAEVSWFPGAGVGGGAGGAVVAWGFVEGDGVIVPVTGNAGTGNPTILTWDSLSFTEDGSGVFSFDPLNPAYIQCSASPQPGYFLSHASVVHDNSTPSAVTFGDVRVFFTSEAPTGAGPSLKNVKQVVSSNIGDPNSIDATLGWALEAWWASRGDTTPIGWFVTVQNFNAGGAIFDAVSVKFAVALVAA